MTTVQIGTIFVLLLMVRMSRGFFNVSGQVKGVGLEVRNQNNELAIPSNAILPKKLMLGTRDSIYRLRLLPNQLPSSVLQYNSQIAFKLDYE